MKRCVYCFNIYWFDIKFKGVFFGCCLLLMGGNCLLSCNKFGINIRVNRVLIVMLLIIIVVRLW